MTSDSLIGFGQALGEVADLLRADRTPAGGSPVDPAVTKVIGRASVVLLSSHFERYIYAVNEEACDIINDSGVCGDALPESLRLIHSSTAVDKMGKSQWQNRGKQLQEFVESDAWLWHDGLPGFLEHRRLLVWMKAPTPQNLVRYYRYWGIGDVFATITRRTHTRKDLRLKLQELVDKRNNIAHGDPITDATQIDVRGYKTAALTFCERADRQLARALTRICGTAPW